MIEKELNKNYIKGIILASNGNEELLINEIQKLCSKEYQKGFEQGKFDATMDAQQREESLIKYIEHKIRIYENRVMENGFDDDLLRLNTYQDILERIKSGKYE